MSVLNKKNNKIFATIFNLCIKTNAEEKIIKFQLCFS